ncbi:hypothetical protein F7725_002929 [Dissostichus mawsoni]|uniref:Uncharacterized protein n=1 Tax=Dissostichus mawsoni TaxID=36200 RepID=A0A7J5YA46_DISMA|nr:hypothetical protein F7725_002929 [Dissostichus mawsoni]
MITQDQKESRSNLGSTLDPAPACIRQEEMEGGMLAGASPVWVVTTAVRRHSEEHAPHRHSGRVQFYRGGRKDQGGEGFVPKSYPRCCTADR